MDSDLVILGKVYLVKIRTTNAFKAPEILWAICHVGKSNVNSEDFRNIVEGLNGLGAYTEIISENKTTWRLLKNTIELKAVGKVGDPLLLTKEVCTFREVLNFAYDRRILTNMQAYNMLALKDEELNAASNPSTPMTMEEAAGVNTPLSLAIETAAQNAKEVAGNGGINVQTGSLSSDQPFGVLPSPALNVDVNGAGENANNDQYIDMVGTGAGGSYEFDASKFNIDDIDNEIEILSDDYCDDMVTKLNRYKALTRKLRDSLSFSCKTVHQLTQALDAKDLQLRELKADGAKEIAAELKPDLNSNMKNIAQRLETIEKDQSESKRSLGELMDCLSLFGFKGNPCTYDIPLTLGTMYNIMNGGVRPNGQAMVGPVMNTPAHHNTPVHSIPTTRQNDTDYYRTQLPPAKQARTEDAQTVSSVFQLYGPAHNHPATPVNYAHPQHTFPQHSGIRRSIFASPQELARHGSS